MGVKRFDDFQTRLAYRGAPLSGPAEDAGHMDMLRPRLYQERPERFAYHLTQKGMAIYEATLMTWGLGAPFWRGSLGLAPAAGVSDLRPRALCRR